MARLPRRTALTTIALGLLVFLPAIAPRAGALWGRATAKKGTHRLLHLAHPLWPHLWKRERVA